jgi:hypothetical protein
MISLSHFKIKIYIWPWLAEGKIMLKYTTFLLSILNVSCGTPAYDTLTREVQEYSFSCSAVNTIASTELSITATGTDRQCLETRNHSKGGKDIEDFHQVTMTCSVAGTAITSEGVTIEPLEASVFSSRCDLEKTNVYYLQLDYTKPEEQPLVIGYIPNADELSFALTCAHSPVGERQTANEGCTNF